MNPRRVEILRKIYFFLKLECFFFQTYLNRFFFFFLVYFRRLKKVPRFRRSPEANFFFFPGRHLTNYVFRARTPNRDTASSDFIAKFLSDDVLQIRRNCRRLHKFFTLTKNYRPEKPFNVHVYIENVLHNINRIE